MFNCFLNLRRSCDLDSWTLFLLGYSIMRALELIKIDGPTKYMKCLVLPVPKISSGPKIKKAGSHHPDDAEWGLLVIPVFRIST